MEGTLQAKRIKGAPSSGAKLVALVGGQHESVVDVCWRHRQVLVDDRYCEACLREQAG